MGRTSASMGSTDLEGVRLTPRLLDPPPVTRPGRMLLDRALERRLLSSDYDRASGQIDVVVDGVLVNRCDFTHVPTMSRLHVRCSVEGWTYTGDARHGRLDYVDGRTAAATSASEVRDIPNWLLCPSLAPIWGRPGERRRLDGAAAEALAGGQYRVPLRSITGAEPDGFADVVWPDGYLSRLVMGEETYLVRRLERDPQR
jgi:hypothetical protein